MPTREPDKKALLLFLVSASLLSFQISLIQIFSIVQWYHFAYMVLSMALLGFGASGTFLTFFRKFIMAHERAAVFVLLICTTLSMPLSIWLTQTDIFAFDTYLVFTERSETAKLVATYILLFIPFFLGATVIGYLLTTTRHVGRLYFANLIGSGAGSLLALAGMYLLHPSRLAPAFCLLSLAAAFFYLPHHKKWGIGCISGTFIITLLFLVFPPQLYLSQYKSLSYALNVPQAEIIHEHSSPTGYLQVVSSDHLRHSPGLSLTHIDPLPTYDVMYLNGEWLGPIYTMEEKEQPHWLENSIFQLPFYLREREDMLVLDAGTGKDVLLGLLNNTSQITAVEDMQNAHRLMDRYSEEKHPHVFKHPNVDTRFFEPRSFLMQDEEYYDMITVPTLDAFGGTGGLYAVQEQYLFTIEAFSEKWNRLSEDGTMMVSSWIDYPFRSPFKLLATVVESLEKEGISDYEDHIAAIKNWGTMVILVNKSPFSPEESAAILDFCQDKQFDPLLLPHKQDKAVPHYHPHQDQIFYEYLALLLTPEREKLYQEYDFRIRPANDNQPYFSQFLRLTKLDRLGELFGERTLPFFELGLILVLATFIQIIIAAVIFILIPLIPLGFKGKNKPWTVLYFAGLGIGFMFIEIAFIQNFILYLGHPIYSATVVIGVMLIASGIGSYFSGRLPTNKNVLLKVPLVIGILTLVYSFFLPPLLQQTITFSPLIRIILAVFFISLLSLVMGLALPVGLNYLSHKDEALTPWAWGINGCFSVISTVVATLLAIHFGFQMIFIAAAFAYLLGSGAGLLLSE